MAKREKRLDDPHPDPAEVIAAERACDAIGAAAEGQAVSVRHIELTRSKAPDGRPPDRVLVDVLSIQVVEQYGGTGCGIRVNGVWLIVEDQYEDVKLEVEIKTELLYRKGLGACVPS